MPFNILLTIFLIPVLLLASLLFKFAIWILKLGLKLVVKLLGWLWLLFKWVNRKLWHTIRVTLNRCRMDNDPTVM